MRGSLETFFPVQIFRKMRKILPHPIDILFSLLGKEIYDFNTVNLPLRHRLRAYSNGFTSKSYRMYGLENKNNINQYLSDFQVAYAREINQKSLGDKQKFYDFMSERNLDQYLPELLGTINNAKFNGDNDIKEVLRKKKKIVLKPYSGFFGRGIYICEFKQDFLILNGKRKKLKEFDSIVRSLDKKYIVTEYCNQADFLEEIYPHSANTMRIWTFYPENKNPFIPIAVLKMGTKKSGFVDNVSQGGLAALIDLETGELGKCANLLSSGEVLWYNNHPDTGARIEGCMIPHWNSIKKELLSLVSKLPEYKYVGWDILLKDNNGSFTIIEGNTKPGPEIQVNKPLLENRRVRNFYRENGVPIQP